MTSRRGKTPLSIAPAELPVVMTQAELAAFLKVSMRTVRDRDYPRLPGAGKPRYLLSEVLKFSPKSRRSA